MFHRQQFCFIFLLLNVYSVFGRTVNIDTQDCFGLPESPITVAGASVSHTTASGRTQCFFKPQGSDQYMSIHPKNLELPRQFGVCPKIQINEYSSVREELIDNTDQNLMVAMIVPADPRLIFEANCSNYESVRSVSTATSSPGLKVQLVFDPFNSAASDIVFQFIFSSFVIGPSFQCPSETFRCWDARSNCIPESLTCDGVYNCLDGSDENNYLCTGRINGIPVPLFAIIIVVSFLALILLVLTIVFVLRKHKRKSDKEEQTWIDMKENPQSRLHQPLLTQQTYPTDQVL